MKCVNCKAPILGGLVIDGNSYCDSLCAQLHEDDIMAVDFAGEVILAEHNPMMD